VTQCERRARAGANRCGLHGCSSLLFIAAAAAANRTAAVAARRFQVMSCSLPFESCACDVSYVLLSHRALTSE
jgi:hypothetical protein